MDRVKPKRCILCLCCLTSKFGNCFKTPQQNSKTEVKIFTVFPLGHLTDIHLVEFLQRCQKALQPYGLIVIKDNVSYEGVVPDELDSSVCRDLEIVHRLVGRAGLRIVYEEQQKNFPKEIYQVHTLALR